MDPVTTSVAKVVATDAADVLKRESESFLAIVLGEPAKAFSGLLADKLNARRHRNLVPIVVEAKRRLADAGLEPKEVPLKVIHPLLEAASLEESPGLQKKWANLLAHAADPRQDEPVSPGFLVVLRELRARDAQFLDALYENSIGIVEHRHKIGIVTVLSEVSYRRDELLKIYGKSGMSKTPDLVNLTIKYYQENKLTIDDDMNDFELILSTAKRHSVLEETARFLPIHLYGSKPINVDFENDYSFSHFGELFMKACRELH